MGYRNTSFIELAKFIESRDWETKRDSKDCDKIDEVINAVKNAPDPRIMSEDAQWLYQKLTIIKAVIHSNCKHSITHSTMAIIVRVLHDLSETVKMPMSAY